MGKVLMENNKPVNGVISDDTRNIAINNIKGIFGQLKFNDSVDRSILDKTINNISNNVLKNRDVLISLNDVRLFDAYIFAHSVNVAVLSMMTGIFLGYSQSQLKILGLGALLHDLGKIKIDKQILYKPGSLTEEEFDNVKLHTIYGYELIKNIPEMPTVVADVALEHHEKIDGSGYPHGKKGYQMHEFSKVVAVTNVFDALLADRPYRKAYLPHEAADILTSTAEKFDRHITKVFLNNIAIYPMGSVVELNSGDVGVVIDVNKGKQVRPIIRLFCNKDREKFKDFREIDLSKNEKFYIVRVLKGDEV